MQLSVIVPFHRDLANLSQCLAAARSAAALCQSVSVRELIVVADGAPEDPAEVARASGATVLAIEGPRGPALARNRGATLATGDLLVFIDSDVVVHEHALNGLGRHFVRDPTLAAAFGAYDEHPTDPGFISQARNLAHAFVHERSSGEARTFWAGLGAIRADVFMGAGGFDERFPRPCVEDIDLGYRVRAANGRIVLDPAIRGTHLKRWTLGGAIVSDVRDRGIPWTQLLYRYGGLHDDLNVTMAYRACVVIAYVLAASLVLAPYWPMFLVAAALATIALWMLERPYYRFFTRRRGVMFALRWFPLHVLHHVCNGISYLVGSALYAGSRRIGLSLPWTLPLRAWDVRLRDVSASLGKLNHGDRPV